MTRHLLTGLLVVASACAAGDPNVRSSSASLEAVEGRMGTTEMVMTDFNGASAVYAPGEVFPERISVGRVDTGTFIDVELAPRMLVTNDYYSIGDGLVLADTPVTVEGCYGGACAHGPGSIQLFQTLGGSRAIVNARWFDGERDALTVRVLLPQ